MAANLIFLACIILLHGCAMQHCNYKAGNSNDFSEYKEVSIFSLQDKPRYSPKIHRNASVAGARLGLARNNGIIKGPDLFSTEKFLELLKDRHLNRAAEKAKMLLRVVRCNKHSPRCRNASAAGTRPGLARNNGIIKGPDLFSTEKFLELLKDKHLNRAAEKARIFLRVAGYNNLPPALSNVTGGSGASEGYVLKAKRVAYAKSVASKLRMQKLKVWISFKDGEYLVHTV